MSAVKVRSKSLSAKKFVSYSSIHLSWINDIWAVAVSADTVMTHHRHRIAHRRWCSRSPLA
jgi:hypothetical protein